MSEMYLQTKDLTKDFGKGRGANDISIEINAGEIVGFIGPNGAGKTTTMRMLMGFLQPDSGNFQLFGKEINAAADLQSVIARVGFMPGEVNMYPSMSANEIFAYSGAIYGHSFKSRSHELAKELDLDAKRQFKYLSLGNRKKVGFIHALLHNPDLIILDEPTSGLDPLIQQKVLTVLKDAKAEGKSVFLSSHSLSEVQQVCDRIIMIKDGKIILQDTTHNILAQALKIFRVSNISEDLKNQLQKIPSVKKVDSVGAELVIYSTEPKPVIELLTTNNRYDFYLERSSLEEMFIQQYQS